MKWVLQKFPNPANNIININSHNIDVIFIYDCTGNTIDKFHNHAAKNINVSEYKSGIYFIHIMYKNKQTNKLRLLYLLNNKNINGSLFFVSN